MRLHRLGTKVYSSVWVRLLEGTFRDGWSNVFQLGVKHSPYMSQSPKPSPNPTVSLFSQPLSVSAAADDFAGVSRLPLSSSCLRSPAPIGLCTVPASKLRTNSGLAPPPLSLVPGPQPLPADRARPGFVECICSTKHKVSKPQRPTPALIRARDKARKGRERDFWNPHSLGGAGIWSGACFCWINKLFYGKHTSWNSPIAVASPPQQVNYVIMMMSFIERHLFLLCLWNYMFFVRKPS